MTVPSTSCGTRRRRSLVSSAGPEAGGETVVPEGP